MCSQNLCRCNSCSGLFCSSVKKINWPQRVNPTSSGSSSVVFKLWLLKLKRRSQTASARCGDNVAEAAAVIKNVCRLRCYFQSSSQKYPLHDYKGFKPTVKYSVLSRNYRLQPGGHLWQRCKRWRAERGEMKTDKAQRQEKSRERREEKQKAEVDAHRAVRCPGFCFRCSGANCQLWNHSDTFLIQTFKRVLSDTQSRDDETLNNHKDTHNDPRGHYSPSGAQNLNLS